eukprot:1145213-Pelagomonas_calceolata.AAC.8
MQCSGWTARKLKNFNIICDFLSNTCKLKRNHTLFHNSTLRKKALPNMIVFKDCWGASLLTVLSMGSSPEPDDFLE